MVKTKQSKYYTVEQVADNLQLHWQTVLDYIKTGALEAIKLGKGYRIPVSSFEKFIQERKADVSLLALASSDEFSSKPKNPKSDRYKSLLIVPVDDRENIFPNQAESESKLREIIKNEIPRLEPKPDVDGMIDNKIVDRLGGGSYELYFRSTSNGVLFVRSALLEPEGEVHIRDLLSFNFRILKLAFLSYKEFGYRGKISIKFRMNGVEGNVLKTGSFNRSLSIAEKSHREIIEVDESLVELKRENVSDLTISLIMKINRGFGHDRVGVEVLTDFLQKIVEGKE